MAAPALTTKARVKERLAITVSSFDDLLDRLILSVSARIESMCGRHFILTTYTRELYDGSDFYNSGKKLLILKNAPVTVMTSIEYKTGSNSNPSWVAFNQNDYDINMNNGMLHFYGEMPKGKQNIRVTYTAGYASSSIGITSLWVMNYIDDTWTINGVNTTFALPVDADEIVVYADGVRILPANYTFTAGTDSIVFDSGFQPFSSLSVDYLPSITDDSDADLLPLEIVEVCEEIVVRLFKKRDSEGRTSESFGESSITWQENVYTDEDKITIKNFRRVWL